MPSRPNRGIEKIDSIDDCGRGGRGVSETVCENVSLSVATKVSRQTFESVDACVFCRTESSNSRESTRNASR